MGLDPSKPYGPGAFREALILGPPRLFESVEGFNWARRTLELIKEDEDAKYYKVTTLLALTSMNGNNYPPEEFIRGARTMAANGGVIPNINHTEKAAEGVNVIDSEEVEVADPRLEVPPQVRAEQYQTENLCAEVVVALDGPPYAEERLLIHVYELGTKVEGFFSGAEPHRLSRREQEWGQICREVAEGQHLRLQVYP